MVSRYQNKSSGVLCYKIMAPDGAPAWAKTAEIWDKLEHHIDAIVEERYKLPETILHFKNTSRVAQTHVFALPIELGEDAWVLGVEELIQIRYSSRGLVAGYAIHPDEGNPHVHIIVSLHAIHEHGFDGRKTRELYSNDNRKEDFSTFADVFNAHLMERGFNARIDPRSHAERGLDLSPFVHEGWFARALAEKGEISQRVQENESIRAENAVRISHDTRIVLTELGQSYATFSENDVLKCAHKRSAHNPILAAFIYESVLASAHYVGEDVHGNKRFATENYKQMEALALALTTRLCQAPHSLSIFQKNIAKTILAMRQSQGYSMSLEQEMAVYNACDDRRLSVLVGRAGTGKTTSLKSIVALHQSAGFDVLGLAISAEASRHLGEDAGITAKTLA